MADKRIDELEEATTITATDLFVLEQANTAKKLSGQTMTAMLTALAQGHGGISSITKTGSAGTNPVVDTYTITFADASTTTFTVTNGLKGDTGATGPTGPKGDDITILSASVQYQEWTSGTQYPTGTWLDNPPAVSQGSYLWTRTLINYSDGTTTTAYSVSRMGIDGSGAVSTVNGVSPDGSGNINLTAANVGALPDNYQAPVASVNGKTGSVNLVASDVSAVPVSGADGFLFRSANAIGQKELMKSLWSAEPSSGWSSGSITVDGLSDYRLFLVRMCSSTNTIYGPTLIGTLGSNSADGTPTSFTASNFNGSGTNAVTLSIQASVSGDTLTMTRAAYVNMRNWDISSGQKVIEIIGVM